jgi:hypothetical protein
MNISIVKDNSSESLANGTVTPPKAPSIIKCTKYIVSPIVFFYDVVINSVQVESIQKANPELTSTVKAQFKSPS